MSTLNMLLGGFVELLTPAHILYLLAGIILGTIVGALPGLGAVSGCAILLPLCFGMDATSAIVMLAAIYYGAMYGGSIPAILINVPGTPAAAITAVDGYPMCKKGRAGAALGMAQIASFFSGVIGVLVLAFAGTFLARYALKFGAPEYFSMTMMGLCLVSGIAGKYPTKGYLMMAVGLFLGTIGIDVVSGVERFDFGSMYLVDGMELVPVLVGVFGFSEIFFDLERRKIGKDGAKEQQADAKRSRYRLRELLPSRKDLKDSAGAITRGGVIGFIVGALPGAGATIAGVLSYSAEKKISKNREQFGEGAIEGVAVCESAKNASDCGAMVPMLALGIPGSATTAILMTALIMFGITPGPSLWSSNNPVLWALIASMFVGNILLVVLNMLCIPLYTAMIEKSRRFLMPVVAILCIIGSFSLRGRMFDVWLMLGFAVAGYFLRKFKFDPLPMALGLILGPTAEKSLRQALILSQGSYSILFTRPISCVMLLVAAATLLLPLLRRGLDRAKSARAAGKQ